MFTNSFMLIFLYHQGKHYFRFGTLVHAFCIVHTCIMHTQVQCTRRYYIVHACTMKYTHVQWSTRRTTLYTHVQWSTRRYSLVHAGMHPWGLMKYTHFHLSVHAYFEIIHACKIHAHANNSTRTRKKVLGFTQVVLY